MTDCRYCGTRGAYDSGFTVECVNHTCWVYNEKHADAWWASQKSAYKECEDNATLTNHNPFANHIYMCSLLKSEKFTLAPDKGDWKATIFNGTKPEPIWILNECNDLQCNFSNMVFTDPNPRIELQCDDKDHLLKIWHLRGTGPFVVAEAKVVIHII